MNLQAGKMTLEEARKIFDYNPKTGVLRWAVPPKGGVHSGSIIKGKCQKGYLRLGYKYKTYRVHRVIWLLVYGEWPKEQIDHINGIKDDNRICNLRAVSNRENHKNMPLRSDNTSGHTGVYWSKRENKWEVRIRSVGKFIFLGYFDDKRKAIEKRKQYERKLNFHPLHGLERNQEIRT